jgi:hypothetical protein
MKKLILFSVLIGLVFWAEIVPAQNTFEFELDYSTRKFSNDAIIDNHGNVITLISERTNTDYSPSDLTKAYILKFNTNGDTSTYRYYFNDTTFNFSSISPSVHNGYLICGIAKLYETEQTFLLLMEVDTAFNPIWVKFHDYSNYWAFGLKKPFIIENKYLVGLTFCGFPCTGDTPVMIWIDGYGNILQQYIHPILTYSSTNFMMNHDSTHIWLFNKGFQGSNGQDARAVFDTSFNFIRLDSLPFTEDYITTKWHTDSTFLFATDYVRPNAEDPNDRELYIVKYDSLLNIKKAVFFGALDTIDQSAYRQTIDFNNPDSVFFVGLKNLHIGMPNPMTVCWVMTGQVDAELNLRYLRFLGGNDYYLIYYIIATPDGGSFICVTKYNHDTKVYNPVFIKLNNEGMLVGTAINTMQIKDALVYPNPVTDKLEIECYLKDFRIQLFDISGKLLIEQEGVIGKTLIKMDNVKSGSYIIQIISKNGKQIESHTVIKY